MAGMHSSEQGRQEPPPTFPLALRGYSKRHVDDFVTRLSEDPDLPVPAFARVMRGYDPRVVDLYIDRVKAAGD